MDRYYLKLLLSTKLSKKATKGAEPDPYKNLKPELVPHQNENLDPKPDLH
jgi:hypothetical protein